MSLNVNIEQREVGVFIVSLTGSLDTETSNACGTKLRPLLVPSTKAVILNMERLDYITSAGLSLIFRTKHALEENSATLVLTNLKPKVKNIFDLTKAISESLFASMDDADEYLDEFIKNVTEKRERENKNTAPP